MMFLCQILELFWIPSENKGIILSVPRTSDTKIHQTMAVWRVLFFALIAVCGGEVDFPPLLDSDDIAYFFERNDPEGLYWALSNVFRRSSRNPIQSEVVVHDLPQQLVSRGGGSTYTTEYKLAVDLEQSEYLVEHLEDKQKAAFFRNTVSPIYKRVLDHIPPLNDLTRTAGLYAFRAQDHDANIEAVYNKALHHTDFDVLRDDDGKALPLLNPALDREELQKQWFGENDAGDRHPGVLIVDNLLSDEALKRIRQLLLESTVWYQTKMPLRFGGYVGAYIDDGLHDRLLLALAFELHAALPRIMKGHPLKYLWAYKYDSDYTGINLHADEAAVNVNIWLTPDEANLDPDSGGLVVFTTKPPSDWDFQKYNTDTDFVRETLLEPSNFANVTVPHRQNRAVIFDSALFHQTDEFRFKKGYENRRINLTLLYGNMQRKQAPSSGSDEL